MTKSQLINALIDQEDLQLTLARLVDIIHAYEQGDMKPVAGLYETAVDDAHAILKELEDGDQPVYLVDPVNAQETHKVKGIYTEKGKTFLTA